MDCVVCGGSDWRSIPDPAANRSVTTAGIILDRGLAKGQCMRCGLVARIGEEFVGKSDYYEEQYANYYRRPGAPVYEARRYRVMADWLRGSIPHLVPRRILDVGCGAGWSMTEVKRLYPEAHIEGVEPSKANSELAKASGFPVHTYKIGGGTSSGSKYDLIYSNNVLTHVLEPVAFLAGLGEMLGDGGRIVIVTVDSTVPSNELLWCDNNYSYLPMHVVRFAERAGLIPIHFEENPDDITMLNKQLMVFGKAGQSDETIAGVRNRKTSTIELYEKRCSYMQRWQQTNVSLAKSVSRHSRVINFGASMWTWLLAGFCPDYWERVEVCTVDGFEGKCIDKAVVPFGDLEFGGKDCLVLGVNPQSQAEFRQRFEGSSVEVISWGRDVRI